mmetsp:Transcript_343/g.720  ORF Transcript_343/g.720 Transcript_343/m.720 type:complete len:326 (-) Transcript_343:143-1120(-)
MTSSQDVSVDARYVSGVVLFFFSLAGCVFPFVSSMDLTVVRPVSTGIVFAVAMVHLLPDAEKQLNTRDITEVIWNSVGFKGEDDDTFPLAQTLMLLGGLIMLAIDQSIPCHHSSALYIGDSGKGEAEEGDKAMGEGSRLLKYGSDDSPHPSEPERGVSGGHDEADLGAKFKVYAMEAAIAVHSIIIGFTIGIKTDTSALTGLTVALIFHQGFEGMALSMAAIQSRLNDDAVKVLIAMFSMSMPMGIIMGIIATSWGTSPDDSGVMTVMLQAVPNAVAAGMLAHIGYELMMQDFTHCHSDSFKVRARKVGLLAIGGAVMCVLGIWA